MTIAVDPELQAQVDAQLLEQGAFNPMDLLIETGRLAYSDYESWRRGEVAFLDAVLMGNPEKIRAQIEAAASYARSIGLAEQAQEFLPWYAEGRDAKPLRISEDRKLQSLISSRYAPRDNAPQMDLFFDNPVVAVTNGIVRALCARNASEAQRLLDRLYEQSPNHADLAAFDRLLGALTHLQKPIEDAHSELAFLLEVTPAAKRLLSSQWRDLLAPLWRQLADVLSSCAFSPETPDAHRSFALAQAQDWPGVTNAVLAESEWWRHHALCLRLAQSGFYRQRRTEALTGWCHLCWQAPKEAEQILEKRRHPDAAVAALWQEFTDFEEAQAEESDKGDLVAPDLPLTAADFPAWLLIHEPSLAQQLPLELPKTQTPGEAHYRCVHRWIQARRAGQAAEELEHRKALRDSHPALFQYLKQRL